MFANIKNGQISKKHFIIQRKKNVCIKVLDILWDEGYILGYKIGNDHIKIYLKYKDNKPVINSIRTVSKPSNKIYYSIKQIWKIDSSKNFLIISTNKGIMSIIDCKKNNLGGEPLISIN